jgi:hypothetical protein
MRAASYQTSRSGKISKSRTSVTGVNGHWLNIFLSQAQLPVSLMAGTLITKWACRHDGTSGRRTGGSGVAVGGAYIARWHVQCFRSLRVTQPRTRLLFKNLRLEARNWVALMALWALCESAFPSPISDKS